MDEDVSHRQRCVFCGSTSNLISKEHVFRERWRIDFEPIIGDVGETIFDAGTPDEIRFFGVPFDVEVQLPCKPCNESWMERMEGSVEAYLVPMATTGIPVTLDPRRQLDLASWAVKTALVLDYLRPKKRVIPNTEYPALYANQRPSTRHIVWIGKIDPRKDNLVVSTRKNRIPRINVPKSDATVIAQVNDSIARGEWLYITTFSLGFTVFQVMGGTLSNPVLLDTGPQHRASLTRIWPLNGQHVRWPPSVSIDLAGGLQAAHEVFGTPPSEES
jgi:hypothetical protein